MSKTDKSFAKAIEDATVLKDILERLACEVAKGPKRNAIRHLIENTEEIIERLEIQQVINRPGYWVKHEIDQAINPFESR